MDARIYFQTSSQRISSIRIALLVLFVVYFIPKTIDPSTASNNVYFIISNLQIVALILVSIGFLTTPAAVGSAIISFLSLTILTPYSSSNSFNAIIEILTLLISVYLIFLGREECQ